MGNIEQCDRCTSSLERGHVQHYEGEKLKETICFKCDAGDHLAEYKKTRKLSASLIMNAAGGNYYSPEDNIKIKSETGVINEAIDDFEKNVWWEGGLQTWNEKSENRGFSASKGSVETRMYTIAGRTMITMLDHSKDIDVTLITSESDERDFHKKYGMPELYMGLQSINATAREAVELIADVKKQHSQGLLNFLPNNGISVL